MNKQMVSGSIAAAWLACGLAVAAQGTEMRPSSTAGNQAAAASTIAVAGCVQSESAVLKRNAAAGEAGMGDEFVLVQATLNPRPATNQTAEAPPAETSGSPGNFGKVYRVTGDKEAELKSYIGQRVEISGTFKDKEPVTDAMSSVGTSGKTELTPANTREITIDAIKPLTGSCTPAIK